MFSRWIRWIRRWRTTCDLNRNSDFVRAVVSSILGLSPDDAEWYPIAELCCTGSVLTVLGTTIGHGRIKVNNDPSFIFLRSLSLLACVSLQIFVPQWFFMMFSTPAVSHFFLAPQSGQVTYPSLSTLITAATCQ